MRWALLILGLASCAETADVPPPGDYLGWKRIDTYGPAPGHGDTYRIIYANDVALTFTGGRYPDGTIIVKEIHVNDHDTPGALVNVEIMRRLGPPPMGLDDQAGWLFTATATPNGTEAIKTSCWRRCHVSAPNAGAWLDYRQ